MAFDGEESIMVTHAHRDREASLGFLGDLREGIDAIMTRDPAARSRLEAVLCYPGLHAIALHRIAHGVWRRGWIVAARMLSHVGRLLTDIEIHPGAQLGRRLFIDHGAGLVIGETAEIGDDVTLYHGVTLGGTSADRGKRHPTLGSGVIVGSGAQILGPITVGDGARIGANAVVLKDVPPGVTMVGVPARQVLPQVTEADPTFHAYGTPRADLPDPTANLINELQAEVERLRSRVDDLEEAASDNPAERTYGDRSVS